jgi:ribose 5-phosphate isomerase A
LAEDFKTAAAGRALERVRDGMRLGIGTGSTAEAFIHLLANKLSRNFSVTGVATSQRTARLCMELGIPLAAFDDLPHLDLTVDGADEIGPGLALVKGGGGALLREKIVAAASDEMIVIADESKLVDNLGAFGIPVEVNEFGLKSTCMAIEQIAQELGLENRLTMREINGKAFVTDCGHLIVDASFGLIPDARALSDRLLQVPGIVQHGLFLEMASCAYVAGSNGVREIFP